jgi:hypothetical protein
VINGYINFVSGLLITVSLSEYNPLPLIHILLRPGPGCCPGKCTLTAQGQCFYPGGGGRAGAGGGAGGAGRGAPPGGGGHVLTFM